MNITVIFQFIVLVFCLSFRLRNTSAYKCENDVRSRRSDDCSNQIYKQNVTLCQTANLKIIPFADSDKKSITITFSLNDTVKYKDCFPYYDIFLVNKVDRATKKCKLFAHEYSGKNYSHTFKNVSGGFYEIDVQPCYTEECCANLSIYYRDLINLTSYDLLSYSLQIPTHNSSVIYVVIAVAVGIILTVFGLYYVCSIRKHGNVAETGSIELDSVFEKAVIYVLHYYDDFGVNKQKVDILKDFLLKSSLYDSVKTIEDALPLILEDVHSWLNDILKERSADEKIQRIVLIDSKEGNEEGPIENLIFNHFISKLNDNLVLHLSSYDSLFVVRMDGIPGSSDKLKNVVRRHRYHLPKHLVELCLNLSSVPKSHDSSIRKYLQEVFMYHPIRNLK